MNKPIDKKKFQKRGGPKKKRRIPRKVKEIAQEHNLSIMSAFRVYQEKSTIEQAIDEDIEREERKEKALEICRQHKDINMALACLLLKEGMTPKDFYAKKEERAQRRKDKAMQQKQAMGKDPQQTPAFHALAEYMKEKVPLRLEKYGQNFQNGILENFTPYEFFFLFKERNYTIHRLEIKYLCKQEHADALKKWIIIDKSILKKKLRPSYTPVGRYQFPEGLLQEGSEIMLALHEGEMIRGRILWFTPYDIMLKAGKSEIWVFRHAVVECALMRRAIKK